jgi:hypothetical protein
MKLPLTDFERHIDPTILKRGEQYHNKGHVTDFDEISYNEYEAIVEGSETYTVRLTIKDGVVTESVCDCPYDLGPVCKHEVAAYYAAREFFAEEDDDYMAHRKQSKSRKPAAQKQPGSPPKPTKVKTIAEQMEEALDTATHGQLKHFVARMCDRDRGMRALFLSQFANRSTPATKEFFAGQIRALASAAAGRHHYIDYSAARRFEHSVEEFVQNGRDALADGNLRLAANIACAVVEEMARALEMADDSSGGISGCAEEAMVILSQVVEQPLDEAFRTELFDYFAEAYTNRLFRSWDWHRDMMSLAISLVHSPVEKKRLADLLTKVKSTDSEWSVERTRNLTAELLLKTEGDAAALRYMEENADNPDFRQKLIEKAISSRDWERAIRLAQDGIRHDEKQKPGLANSWREYLLVVYRKTGDHKNVVQLLSYFLTSTHGGGRSSETYFRELKKLTPPEQWPATLEGMVRGVNGGHRWENYYSISAFRIWEGQWDKLLELLQRNASLSRIADAEKYLKADYAPQLAALYRQCILDSMKPETNVNRKHYREVCRYLRRMIKLGARAEAQTLTAELRRLYPARRALMEELNNV